jgi:hypothetical protein
VPLREIPAADAYWRSREGGDEWERLLSAHMARIRSQAGQVERFPRIVFDIEALTFADDATRRLFITRGLSRFVLGRDLRWTRHELCWVVPAEVDPVRAADLLYDLADRLLEQRRELEDDELLDDFPIGPYLPDGCTVTCLAVKFKFWLDAEDAFVDSHYPLRIAELVPLTPGEAALHERDLAGFIQRYDDEQLDMADFRR